MVDGAPFSWRLEPGRLHSKLVVRGGDSAGQALVVTLTEWRDPWLNVSGVEATEDSIQLYTSARNEPAVISSRFVREVILAGLMYGWQPTQRGQPLALEHRQGAFSLSGPTQPA